MTDKTFLLKYKVVCVGLLDFVEVCKNAQLFALLSKLKYMLGAEHPSEFRACATSCGFYGLRNFMAEPPTHTHYPVLLTKGPTLSPCYVICEQPQMCGKSKNQSM